MIITLLTKYLHVIVINMQYLLMKRSDERLNNPRNDKLEILNYDQHAHEINQRNLNF